MQDFLVSFAKILDILGLLAQNSKKFFGFFFHNLGNSCKILPTLPKKIPKKTKTPSAGCPGIRKVSITSLSGHVSIVLQFSVSKDKSECIAKFPFASV